jgi:hypothetical protein
MATPCHTPMITCLFTNDRILQLRLLRRPLPFREGISACVFILKQKNTYLPSFKYMNNDNANTCQTLKVMNCSDLVHTVFRPYSDLLKTLFWPCSSLVLTLFKPCSDLVQTLFWLFSDHVQTLFWLCSELVLTLFWPCSDLFLTLFWPCSVLVHTLFWSYSDHVHTLFIPCSDLVLTLYAFQHFCSNFHLWTICALGLINWLTKKSCVCTVKC